MIRKIKNCVLILFCFVFTFCICLDLSNASDQNTNVLTKTVNADVNNKNDVQKNKKDGEQNNEVQNTDIKNTNSSKKNVVKQNDVMNNLRAFMELNKKNEKVISNLNARIQDQEKTINDQKTEINTKNQDIVELQGKLEQDKQVQQQIENIKVDGEKHVVDINDTENNENNDIANHNLSLQNNYFALSGITYNPSIDISSSILDSNDFIYFGDNYNIEGDNVNVKLGFNYTNNTKHSINNNFNKYIVFNPQIEGFNNLYFSVVNYYDLFSKSNVNSMDLRKNYYTLYTKFKLNGINNLYLGFGYGYIPFEKNTNEIKNNKKGHFNKYTLFAILNTSIDVEDAEDVTLINRLGFDINVLSSNYRLNEDTSNVYLKLKDSILVNTLVDVDTDLFAGLNFGLFNTNREFLKKIGLTDTFEYGITGGVKFEYGTIGISCGNLGFGLNFGINY